MLYDLTRIQGARVDEADDVKVTRHYYMRTNDLKLLFLGALAGLVPAGLLQPWLGMASMILPAIGATTGLILFTRKRSVEGERHERRWDRLRDMVDPHRGRFVLPGSDAFQPSDTMRATLDPHPHTGEQS